MAPTRPLRRHTQRDHENVAQPAMETAPPPSKVACPPMNSVRNTLGKLRWTIALLSLAAILSSSGCSMLNNAVKQFRRCEPLEDFMIGHRNLVFGKRAWFRIRDRYHGCANVNEFRDGFLAGYADVANGGSGCTPNIAPTEFWGWRYQSAGGQAAIQSWFAGYPLGAKAAEEDGIAYWGRVPVSLRSPATIGEELMREEAMQVGPSGELIPVGPEASILQPEAVTEPLQLQPNLAPPVEAVPEITDPMPVPAAEAPNNAVPAPVQLPPAEEQTLPLEDSTNLPLGSGVPLGSSETLDMPAEPASSPVDLPVENPIDLSSAEIPPVAEPAAEIEFSFDDKPEGTAGDAAQSDRNVGSIPFNLE